MTEWIWATTATGRKVAVNLSTVTHILPDKLNKGSLVCFAYSASEKDKGTLHTAESPEELLSRLDKMRTQRA